MDITRELFKLADDEYRKFHSRLMPTVDGNRIIGVRTPVLRKFAAGIDEEAAKSFIRQLPHKYYEENNLHAFLLEKIGDFDRAMAETERFLPYVDNWATCDMLRPKCFNGNEEKLIPIAERWLSDTGTYVKRYGIVTLMKCVGEEHFDEKLLKLVADVESDEYYVKMAVAWFFATSLTKRQQETIVFLRENPLDVWTHNKAIQKALESNIITKEQKEYLKTLKIK